MCFEIHITMNSLCTFMCMLRPHFEKRKFIPRYLWKTLEKSWNFVNAKKWEPCVKDAKWSHVPMELFFFFKWYHLYIICYLYLLVEKCNTGISQFSAYQSLQDIVQTTVPAIATPKKSRARARHVGCMCTKGCRTARCRCVINLQVWFGGPEFFFFFVLVKIVTVLLTKITIACIK